MKYLKVNLFVTAPSSRGPATYLLRKPVFKRRLTDQRQIFYLGFSENKEEDCMAAEPRQLMSDDLLRQVEETARFQNRQPEEVVSEAVRKYLDDQKWERLVTAGEQRAKARGPTEADVPRLIEEVRNENRTRGR